MFHLALNINSWHSLTSIICTTCYHVPPPTTSNKLVKYKTGFYSTNYKKHPFWGQSTTHTLAIATNLNTK